MPAGKVEQVKGEAIVSELGWVKHKKGEDGKRLVFEDLNEGRPSHLLLRESDFKPDGWYPVEIQQAVLKSIEKRFGNGKADILKEVGAYGIKNISKFTFFIRFMDPHKVGDKLAGSITLLYRSLLVEVKHPGETEMEVDIKGFPRDEVYVKLMQGGIEQIMEFLKVGEPMVKDVGGVEDGIRCCKFTITWK